MLEPIDILYDICRHYVNDQTTVVEPNLISRVLGYCRARDLARLATCSCHFDSALHRVNDWKFLRQVEAFFKKNANLSNKDVCTRAASESFFKSEAECAQTNVRLKRCFSNHELNHGEKILLFKMEHFILNVLGDFSLFLEELPSLVKVTPGATSTTKRSDSLPQLKMKMRLFASRRAAPYLKAMYHLHGFNELRVKVTHSNRVELVPKNWKTDRTIACEPEGNLPLQLAFDTYAKRRLRLFGVDLTDQTANQKLCRYASIHGGFATVDFERASDTISYNLIDRLLPVDWFKFLADVRSPSYRGAFGIGTYSKFSSMGNGSTFCLESLVFAAACHAVGSSKFQVYGDDVIIEEEYYEAFLALTRFLGFTINTEKTFVTGPFRESCGLDCYDGIDVTPVYIRAINRQRAVLCHLVNSLGVLTFPHSELAQYLSTIVHDWKLPAAPYTESTLAGVWIDTAKARGMGILKRVGQIDRFRGYQAHCEPRAFVDSRGYYLWFLARQAQVLFSGPWELARQKVERPLVDPDPPETSSVPVFTHKYVRRRVAWIKPRKATPDHLIWCSEAYFPRKPKIGR